MCRELDTNGVSYEFLGNTGGHADITHLNDELVELFLERRNVSKETIQKAMRHLCDTYDGQMPHSSDVFRITALNKEE